MTRENQILAVAITVSDACARGEREDASGKALVELLGALPAEIVDRKILPDDLEPLSELLKSYADRGDVKTCPRAG